VDIGKNVWACQSDSCVKARGGRRGGNVLEFVAVKEGVTVREAALRLASWFNIVSPPPEGSATEKRAQPAKEEPPTGPREPREDENQGQDQAEPNKPLKFTLKGVDSSHGYLTGRGITEETARRFGVGHFPGNGSMKGRVVFPIRNRGGEIVAYAGRAIDDSVEPRWKFPAGFRKSLELFGAYEAANRPAVALVESFWGVLALYQAGFPAVALMGRSLSEDQQALLVSLGPASIVTVLDGDEPGRAAVPEIAVRLARHHFVRIVDLPDDVQPDHLNSEDLRKLLGVCFAEPRA
jgi:DNA primase